jgi:RimJ/RimL family protein N-acetyltransferase
MTNETATTTTATPRAYPRNVTCGGDARVEIARMTSADREALVAFVATLPAHDLLFVPRDLTHAKVVEAWMRSLDAGEVTSLGARHDGALVGCTAIVSDELSWSRHVGELRVLVGPAWRGRGLGRLLIQECFAQALELGLKKLVAQMTTDQRAAIAVFEQLGFRAEALLTRHVAGRDGTLHDLVLLSHDVEAVQARNDLYGMSDALQD